MELDMYTAIACLGFLLIAARHYVTAKTAATVRVHGTGPFTLNYVNPSDDPGKPGAPK
jgi:hypothetical protein